MDTMNTYVEECYKKEKTHNTGKTFVEHFPLQILEGLQSKTLKTLKIYTSEGQSFLSPLVLVNLMLNLTFMFILWLDPNSKIIENRV